MSDDSWRTLLPTPLHVDVYAAILARPTLASALLAVPVAVPMFFLFPVFIDMVPGGFASETWHSLPVWSRFLLGWVSGMITFQFHFRRPY
jgi:hypothetical protein